MAPTSKIEISLKRQITVADEKAVSRLMSQWLVYDAKIRRRRSTAEIELYHTAGATPDLIKEIAELFPGESMTDM